MRLLNDQQLEQLLEVTRKGTPIEGSVLYKLCFDIKNLRAKIRELCEARNSKGVFSRYKSNKKIRFIIKQLEEML